MKLRRGTIWCVGTVLALLLAGSTAFAQPKKGSNPLEKAVEKATADLAAAAKKKAELAADLPNLEKDLAAKTDQTKAAMAKGNAAQALVEKASGEEKVKAQKAAAAAKIAAEKAALTQKAAAKLLTERREALAAATTREQSAKTALENAHLEKHLKSVADARVAVLKAETDQEGVLKNLQPKATAAKSAAAVADAAKAVAVKAAREAAVAKTALDKAGKENRGGLEKAYKEKDKAAQAAANKAKAAQLAAEKAAAELKAAAQAKGDKGAALRTSMSQLAAAKAQAYGGLQPLPDSAWDYAKARHLLYRAGFGGSPDEVAKLHAMGLHRAVDHLVNFKVIAPAHIPFVAQLPERPEPYEKRLPPKEQNIISQRRQRVEAQQIQGLRNWWLKRMVESPRPLEERLTLFWHGLFACQYTVVFNSHFMYTQNQLFRENAAGNYGALLNGIVHDPTMIRFLNNDTNVKGRPNENLAREIMELFAMGLDQGYTEFDIREAARALTGYTYDNWSSQFRFLESRHDHEPKTIFGQKGPWTGDDLANLILQQPATSRFIAKRLFMYFVHDNPDQETVERLAKVLRLNNYELVPMLENLFTSEEFYGAKSMGTQIKSPIQLVAGTLRELGISDMNYGPLVQAVRDMGQELLEPPSVKGWDGGRTWINATRMFIRYNTIANILENMPRMDGKTGVDVVGTLLAGKNFQSNEEIVDYFARCFYAVPLSQSKRQNMVEFLGGLPPCAEWSNRRSEVNAKLTSLLVIMLCSPEYQLT